MNLKWFIGPERIVIISIVGLAILGFYFYIANSTPPHFSNIRTPASFPCTSLNRQAGCVSTHSHNQIIRDNSDALILTHKANDLYKLGKYNQSILYYNKALTLQPDDPDLLINKGNALYHTTNYSGAIKYYDKALAAFAETGIGPNQSRHTDNSTISVEINKANALFHIGNYSGAVKYYDEALSAAPDDIAAQKGKMLSERAIQKYR